MTDHQKARWAEIQAREETLRCLVSAHAQYRDDAMKALEDCNRELLNLTREKAAMLNIK